MNEQELHKLAADLLSGRVTQADFVAMLGRPATAELGDVTLDLDRITKADSVVVVAGL